MQERERNNNNLTSTGIGMINVMANISYAGMRAQNSQNHMGRALAFIAGFPGTVLTYFLVDEGSEQAYGVEIPKKTRRNY
jgi:hypothetical protein